MTQFQYQVFNNQYFKILYLSKRQMFARNLVSRGRKHKHKVKHNHQHKAKEETCLLVPFTLKCSWTQDTSILLFSLIHLAHCYQISSLFLLLGGQKEVSKFKLRSCFLPLLYRRKMSLVKSSRLLQLNHGLFPSDEFLLVFVLFADQWFCVVVIQGGVF